MTWISIKLNIFDQYRIQGLIIEWGDYYSKVYMEDYVKKRNYLNHLKQISAIKNGHCKSGITLTKSRASLSNINQLKENVPKIATPPSKFIITKRTNQPLSSRNKSTEQIMKNFSIEKENLRLV